MRSSTPLIRRLAIPAVAIIASLVAAFLTGSDVSYEPFSISYSDPNGIEGFLKDLFLGVAAAAFIAAAISETVEQSSRRRLLQERERLEEHTKNLTETTLRSVAASVWGVDHSIEVSEEIVASNLSSPLLRENYVQRLRFTAVAKHTHIVRVSHLIEYDVINPSMSDAIFEPKISFDDTTVIYPKNPEFQPPLVSSIVIGEDTLTSKALHELNDRLYGWRGSGALIGDATLIGSYRIGGKGRVPVRLMFDSTEPIDSQWVARVFVPTKGVRVTAYNGVGPNFRIFILPLFREDFGPEEIIEPTGAEWQRRYDGVLLPHSGFVLRWNDVSRTLGGGRRPAIR